MSMGSYSSSLINRIPEFAIALGDRAFGLPTDLGNLEALQSLQSRLRPAEHGPASAVRATNGWAFLAHISLFLCLCIEKVA